MSREVERGPDFPASSRASSPSDASPESGAEKQAVEQPAAPPSPPNGGVVAWLQVVGAFFLFFNSWGVVNTFGVFQSYYEDTLLPEYSASSISWIGTVQGFLLFIVGVVVGPAFDKGYLKTLIALGTFLVVFGLMMTSLSTKYYQVFLAHGVAVGIGCACLFLPSVATVATYFSTKRAVATGIVASGGSIGSVIFPIVFHRLIGPLGFGWTTRIIGFIALGGAPLLARCDEDASAACKAGPQDRRPLRIQGVALPHPECGLVLRFHRENISFYIIAILNAASVFGRITPGLLADRVGSINTIIPISLIASVLAFAWIGIRNEAGTIVFAIIYGYASGAIVSLPPTIVAKISPNLSIVGTRMGMCFTFAGLGLLIGNPIAGTLLDLPKRIFWKAQLFSAVTVVAGSALFILLRIIMGKKIGGWKM
ncbi:hypothetical protein N7470_009767 [Penicillium chermesinum]|nr:hypothetical protein N7470_009767 [Penicillium chermesinum]